MASRINIENILDRAHLIYRQAEHRQRAILIKTHCLDSVIIKELINEGITEFTAISNKGVINIVIEY